MKATFNTIIVALMLASIVGCDSQSRQQEINQRNIEMYKGCKAAGMNAYEGLNGYTHCTSYGTHQ